MMKVRVATRFLHMKTAAAAAVALEERAIWAVRQEEAAAIAATISSRWCSEAMHHLGRV